MPPKICVTNSIPASLLPTLVKFAIIAQNLVPTWSNLQWYPYSTKANFSIYQSISVSNSWAREALNIAKVRISNNSMTSSSICLWVHCIFIWRRSANLKNMFLSLTYFWILIVGLPISTKLVMHDMVALSRLSKYLVSELLLKDRSFSIKRINSSERQSCKLWMLQISRVSELSKHVKRDMKRMHLFNIWMFSWCSSKLFWQPDT
jgi:hypothetical protein